MPRRRPEKITVVRTVFTDLDKAYPSDADKAEGRVLLAYYNSLSVAAVRDCLKAYEYFEETVGHQLPDGDPAEPKAAYTMSGFWTRY